MPEREYKYRGGLASGGPRYIYRCIDRERFATRWGDWDMYVTKKMCDCHLDITITTISTASGLRNTVPIGMFQKPDGEWAFQTVYEGNTDQLPEDYVNVAKWAVCAYNELMRLGGAVDDPAYVGDAMERLA